MIQNKYKVQKKTWNKWTASAKHMFNHVYDGALEVDIDKGCTITVQAARIAWNGAWTAAHNMDWYEKELAASLREKDE